MKSVWKDLVGTVRSPFFWCAAALVFLSFEAYAFGDWVFVWHWDVISRPSSLEMIVDPILVGGVVLIVPLSGAMCGGPRQADERRTSFYDFQLMRGNMIGYTLRKCFSAFLSGAICVGGVFAFHVILWHILATPWPGFPDEARYIPFDPETLLGQWESVAYSLPIYLVMFIGMAFTAGVWSVFGCVCGYIFKDRLLSMAVPFGIYYLWHGGFLLVFLGLRNTVHPSDLFNEGLTWTVIQKTGITYLLILLLLVTVHQIVVRRQQFR